METESSLPYSQAPATCLYLHVTLSKATTNIVTIYRNIWEIFQRKTLSLDF
jgi:hypothetical protein